MIGLTTTGDSNKTSKALQKLIDGKIYGDLNRYGQMGVTLLSSATPVDSSITANSWKYRIVRERNGPRVEWYNTHVVDGVNVAVLIQYGHATRTGGYVNGRDYINPVIQPMFDDIINEIWKRVIT